MKNIFLYFFPETPCVTKDTQAATYKRFGLDRVLNGTDATCRDIKGGPGGRDGVLVCATSKRVSMDSRNTACAYDPQRQTWICCGNYYLGYWNDAKPTPDSLAREEQVAHYGKVLGDGNEWCLAAAIAHNGAEQLPRMAAWGPDGKWVKKVIPEYASLSAKAKRVAEDVYAHGEITLDEDEALNFAVECLALNYHVGKFEVSALGVFAPFETMASWVIFCFVDYPEYVKWKVSLGNAETPADTAGDNTLDGSAG